MKIKFEKTHDVYEDRFFFFIDWLDEKGHGLKEFGVLMRKSWIDSKYWIQFQEEEYGNL